MATILPSKHSMKVFVVVCACLALANGLPGILLPEALRDLDWEPRSEVASCGVSRAGTRDDDGDKIVGGRDAKQGELPWQVSLQQKSWTGSFSHICGGTVLNARYIITAAHCVGGAASNYQIVVGGHNLRSPTRFQKAHGVASVKIHEQYNSRTIMNDIAILRLSTPIDFSGSEGYVNGACLPESRAEPSGTVSVSGWGATREGGSAPAVLQVVSVPVVSTATCRSQYGTSQIADSMLCAGLSAGGKDSCQGDSGGPLVQHVGGRAYLLGVVSWGAGCARPNYSGVYTKVSHYISWIKTNTP